MARWLDLPKEIPVDAASIARTPLPGYNEKDYSLYAIDVMDDGLIVVHYHLKMRHVTTPAQDFVGHCWQCGVQRCSPAIRDMVARELSK
jgi:hypothetical protein